MKNYKDDFSIFNEIENLHYLDNAATTQRPKVVMSAISEYYSKLNGNASRGSHSLAMSSTKCLEDSRSVIADFVGTSSENVIFTKNCTEAANIVAYSYGLANIKSNDEIIVSISNHHANIVNWQFVCEKTGAKLRYVYLNENGEINLDELDSILNENTKLIAFSGIVNATGVINNIEEIVKKAHNIGVKVLLDAAQSITHFKHKFDEWDIDFMCFSGHKLFSIFGVGVLVCKNELFDIMPPFLYGGDMIEFVEEQKSTFKSGYHKFEGGTMDVGAIYSLKAAVEYINDIGFDEIENRCKELEQYALDELKKLDFIILYHANKLKGSGIIAFNIRDVHSHDSAYILNEYGVMLRSGHHCTQPLMKYLNINSCLRVSVTIYNDKEDIDAMINALKEVKKIFK